MTNSGLYPVQTWLLAVLDDLGIDGVIYSRHVLDLLISSKHSFDYRLDEKEQSIFSKIAPSTTKKKRKYSRRSSSFSSCEEILWKKEVAVSCLLSATETKVDSREMEAAIQLVVDELYSKLSGLNLTSDGKSTVSDGDSPLNNNKSLNNKSRGQLKKKKHNKENYEDAFPSLAGSKLSPDLRNSFDESVWCKADKDNNPKSGLDPNTNVKERPYPLDVLTQNKSPRRLKTGGTLRRPRVRENPNARHPPKRSPGYYPRYPRKRRTPREFKSTGFEAKTSPSATAQKQPLRQRNRVRTQLKFDSNGDKNAQGKGNVTRKRRKGTRNAGNLARFDANYNGYGNVLDTEDFSATHYAHLPSWMETTLIDVSQLSSASRPQETRYSSSSDDSIYGEEIESEMAFSKQWYRDPVTGLLTYRPLKSPGGNTESAETKQAAGQPSAAEVWMWCPSPTLWEDGSRSPVSRLESVYKKELRSFGTEKHADNLSGRIWEEYKPIFMELNDMSSEDEPDQFSGHILNHFVSHRVRRSPELQARIERHLELLMASSLDTECTPTGPGHLTGPNIWKYSPKKADWPDPDEIVRRARLLEELSEMMDKGRFGYRCVGREKKDEVWGGEVEPSGQGGDDSETMTNALVNALFSDSGFDLLTVLSMQHARPPSEADVDLPPSVSLESLLFSSRIERFPQTRGAAWPSDWTQDWQRRCDSPADDWSSLTDLDEVFRSMALEDLDDQRWKSKESKTVLDSVTENQVWKTSLRIGNSWQNISGIRPVNVIYSENESGLHREETLVPSADTHFRPISTSIGDITPDSDAHLTIEALYTAQLEGAGAVFHTIHDGADNKKPVDLVTSEDLTVANEYCKMGKDKSMQTSFEMAVQHHIPSCQQFVLPRPPKANSR